MSSRAKQVLQTVSSVMWASMLESWVPARVGIGTQCGNGTHWAGRLVSESQSLRLSMECLIVLDSDMPTRAPMHGSSYSICMVHGYASREIKVGAFTQAAKLNAERATQRPLSEISMLLNPVPLLAAAAELGVRRCAACWRCTFALWISPFSHFSCF